MVEGWKGINIGCAHQTRGARMRLLKAGSLVVIGVLLVSASSSMAVSSTPGPLGCVSAHVIEGIPYVAQTGRIYCYYACLAMVLNFMGLNTSLDEILFFGGVGYAHACDNGSRLPSPRVYSTDVLGYFGVQESRWYAGIPDPPSEENWTAFCIRFQENITNDRPVLVIVDPFSLPSLRGQYAVGDRIWSGLFPSGIHVILLIGYDSANESVCYQDPNAGYYGSSRFGDHAWMTFSELRTATESSIVPYYEIGTFTQVSPAPPRAEAAALALQHNHELLNGSRPDSGINATKQLCQWYSAENRSETITLYGQQGGPRQHVLLVRFLHQLLSVLRPLKPNVFDLLSLAPHDPFKEIAVGKNHVADYLGAATFLAWGANESRLLRDEARLWEDLSQRYEVFLLGGGFVRDPLSENIMETMENRMHQVLEAEQTILDND